MRIVLAAVGRARGGPERALYDHFIRRITYPLTLKEVEERRPLPAADRIAREGEMLLAAVPPGAAVVALDERGEDLPSAELARRLARWRDGGTADIAFLIGGADGHADAVRKRADLLLAFGRQTWPHMMVRAMLAEQIFRAQSILQGHPYHRA